MGIEIESNALQTPRIPDKTGSTLQLNRKQMGFTG
jgi:hypothetical protein